MEDFSYAFNALKAVYGDRVQQVDSVDSERAAKPGEGYTSDVKRVLIKVILNNGEKATLRVICKTHLDGEKTNNILNDDLQIFKIEIKVYTEVLPVFEKLLEEINDKETRYWPQCIHVVPYTQLVLDDLNVSNFKCLDRLKGFDLKFGEYAIRALGKFHALSVAVKARGLVEYSTFDSFYLCRNLKSLHGLFSGSIKLFSEVVASWGDEWCKTAKFVEDMSENFGVTLMELRKGDEDKFLVFNHGDYWVSNIMFKLNDLSEPLSIRYLDFQMSHYGSLGWDLVCMLFTNSDLTIVYPDLTRMIRSYRDEYARVLGLLVPGLDAPSTEDVLREVDRLLYLGLFYVTFDLPNIMAPSEDILSVEEMATPEGVQRRRRLYTTQKFTAAAQTHLKFFMNKGVIK